MGRVIVSGVGYPDLADYSVGIVTIEALASWSPPDNVVVEDLSYNPIAVVQRFQDEAPDRRFTRAVFVSAVARPPRSAGTVKCYRWDGTLPDEEDIQRAVTDGVTGIIALSNTLVIAKHFGALPDEVVVVEVEPQSNEFGGELSPPVAESFERVCALMKTFATDESAVAQLPLEPLDYAVSPGWGLTVR
jgi:hydrogenase maturation protease